MKKKKVTKLWQGKFVSVRDYEVKAAIKKGGLEIVHNGQFMQLKPDELLHLQPSSKVFQSRFKGSYRLIDILFKPLTEDPNQGKLI
jgi:hypothetical protein